MELQEGVLTGGHVDDDRTVDGLEPERNHRQDHLLGPLHHSDTPFYKHPYLFPTSVLLLVVELAVIQAQEPG